MPKDAGKGKGKFRKFYYDQAKEKCYPFNYKGTAGNSNRFDSKELCEEQCGFEAPGMAILNHFCENSNSISCFPPDICNLDLDVGTGPSKGAKKRFWYNAKKGKCQKFKYTMEGGNENNFKNKKECKKACMVSLFK